ncbi:MAG: serine/threonine-protein kinase [Ardenticatenaceae bacterium]
MALSKGYLLLDSYRIESQIGEGTFGRIYRARDMIFNRVMTIKELLYKGKMVGRRHAAFAERIRRAAKIQSKVRHPNIVRAHKVVDAGAGRLYLMTEHVNGRSVRDCIKQHGPLPTSAAIRMTQDVLAALSVVHQHPMGIVHRNIKPSNILLTARGRAKLTDFGLAQITKERKRALLSQPRHPGTAFYMSPEQRGSAGYLTPASDLFSVGCVLFEMLTAQSYVQARRQKHTLLDLRPDLPTQLVAAIQNALAPQPDDRYHSAAEFAKALEMPTN